MNVISYAGPFVLNQRVIGRTNTRQGFALTRQIASPRPIFPDIFQAIAALYAARVTSNISPSGAVSPL